MRLVFRLLVWLGFFSTALSADLVTQEFEGALYHLYRVPASQQTKLDLRWTDDQGKPLSDFSGLHKQLTAEGKKILFATNAGIYERGPKPCRLTIVSSKELVPLNHGDSFGNFFLKPNGVFISMIKAQALLKLLSTRSFL